MPRPLNERQSLEQERAELPSQIAVYLRELTETSEAPEYRARRERLAWQVRNLEKRLAEVEARLAGAVRRDPATRADADVGRD